MKNVFLYSRLLSKRKAVRESGWSAVLSGLTHCGSPHQASRGSCWLWKCSLLAGQGFPGNPYQKGGDARGGTAGAGGRQAFQGTRGEQSAPRTQGQCATRMKAGFTGSGRAGQG